MDAGADAARRLTVPPSRFTHIGGPTTLIEVDGWRILTDPTFDAPGRTYRFGWGTSSRKTTGPAIAADEIGPLDVVLLTHEHHADNLDDAGRTLLPAPARSSDHGVRRGPARRQRPRARPWDSDRLRGPRPAGDHGHRDAVPPRSARSHPIVGDVIGFSLTWEGQDTARCGSPATPSSTTASARSPTGRRRHGRAAPGRRPVPDHRSAPLHDDRRRRARAVRAAPPAPFPVHYEGWSHFHEGRGGSNASSKARQAPRSDTSCGQPADVPSASPRDRNGVDRRPRSTTCPYVTGVCQQLGGGKLFVPRRRRTGVR